ncbi:hypothetical protein CY0110_10727 [Crocosphaera chwakensis CCY0110]|uniref:NERD domain-containing protein n=1 Tax=Crocosphaera chwakensis CCY0110 TaxID=391612 RepID=A3IHA2_9CHRO|nr:element excision factor XisH family protein [Crocosphaera chwakensis]EAZ94344.1 hypothetical protein CY0110_10727 [Crocosphaera chwakensis CCY0110]
MFGDRLKEVHSDIYYSFFELRFIQTVIQRLQIYLIVYDPIEEIIVEWKN